MARQSRIMDALDLLEGRLNRELPRDWRSAYGYDRGPMEAVLEAWEDALDLAVTSREETAALAVLEIAVDVKNDFYDDGPEDAYEF